MNTNPATLWLGIGWTMLHFLWLGIVVAAGTAAALRVLRGASPEMRYAVALAGMAMLALAPAAIAWRLARSSNSVEFGYSARGGQGQAVITAYAAASEAGTDNVAARVARHDDHAPASPFAQQSVRVDGRGVLRPDSLQAPFEFAAACLPWIWLVGSPLTFAWLALGLAGAERLRLLSRPLPPGSELSQHCRRLAVSFGIGRHVAVAICDRVPTPVLVGIVRPLILLPTAAMGGWAPDQFEMVLLHELAHVRRWDNLVNLLQRVVESLLFFHPAVWIISGWIRQEREHCCDRIVVVRTGRAHAYAETLLALASERAPLAAISVAVAPRKITSSDEFAISSRQSTIIP